ncbi:MULTISPECIES: acylphosphatase [unclassified Gilliamella]|uniref:acylphosphatase n=1 Tax=unclassified Gilliamella TaxID=2685620 RepID=UPI000A347B40|nr:MULTISPECIES: acylphosphatase [unclassified Gilliamella]
MIRQVKIRVSGRVQGVGFRFFTYQKATKLGLVGYVKNLDNGEVEIVAQGDNISIAKLIQWFEQGGPVSARITEINVTELIPENQLNAFNIKY